MKKPSSMNAVDRRGEVASLLGLLLSILAGVFLLLLGLWSQNTSSAIWGACFQLFGCAGVWILTYIQLHQQRLVDEEKLEIADLERQRREKLGGVKTIFDEEEIDQMDRFAMGRRMRSIERILLPVLAMFVAAFHLLAGLAMFPWAWQFPAVKEAAGVGVANAEQLLFCTGGIAFACFMMSRYAIGLSRLKSWAVIRAGANYLFGASVVCLAISIALLCEIVGLPWVEPVLGTVIGYLLVILAIETVANFILDFYRPRIRGEHFRPFYDSRILGVFGEPGNILRSMANNIDYQFGFKVSETWFYKLLGSFILPLLVIQIIVIFLLTCIVVVPPGNQAVIERLGRPLPETLKPGVHFTYCWPVDRATVIPVAHIQRMLIGHEIENEEAADSAHAESRPPILWTKTHYKKEYQLLVADKAASVDAKVPVNLLIFNLPLQWSVKHETDADVIQYHTQSQDAAGIIESLAYRELTRYAASADIFDLLGGGETAAATILQTRIQAACDQAGYNGKGLGVRIEYVGIGGVHPPAAEQVAQTYQDVVSAIEKKHATIMAAEGDADKAKIGAGGVAWEELYTAIQEEDQSRRSDLPQVGEKTTNVEKMLSLRAGGKAREITADASQKALARIFDEWSSGIRYSSQLAAYEAGPKTFMLRSYLRLMESGLKNVRTFVVALDHPEKVLYEVDLKPDAPIDVLGAEIRAADERNQ